MPGGVIVAFSDVSSLDRELDHEHDLERSILSHLDQCVVLCDADGRVVFRNPAAARAFSIPPGSRLTDQLTLDHGPGASPHETLDLLRDALRSAHAEADADETVLFLRVRASGHRYRAKVFRAPDGACVVATACTDSNDDGAKGETVGAARPSSRDERASDGSSGPRTSGVHARLERPTDTHAAHLVPTTSGHEDARDDDALRTCLAAAQIGTWHADLRSGVDTRDATLNAIFGLRPVESRVPIEDFTERVHFEDRPLVVATLDRAVREIGAYDLTFRIVRPDETIRWVRDVGRVERDAEGASAIRGAVIDVTATERARSALVANGLRYRALVLGAHPVTLTFDVTGAVRGPQALWCAFTGQRLEATLGRGWLRAIHERDRENVASRFEEALAKCVPLRMNCRLQKQGDSYRHVLFQAVPVLSDDGHLREWIASAIDLTPELASQFILGPLFDDAPFAASVVARDLTYVRANRSMKELDGIQDHRRPGTSLQHAASALRDTLERLHRQVQETGEAVVGVELIVPAPALRTASPISRGDDSPISARSLFDTAPSLDRSHDPRTASAEGGTHPAWDTARHWLASFYPLRHDELVVGSIVVAHEVTARKHAERAFVHLARSSGALFASLDLTTTLKNTASAFVPTRGDWAAVYLNEGDGLALGHCMHAAPNRSESLTATLRRARCERSSAVMTAVRTGRSTRFESIADDTARVMSAPSAESFDAFRALELRSCLILPLVVDGHTVGVVLVADESRTYRVSDVPLSEELARRAALAIDHAERFAARSAEAKRVEEADRAKDDFLAVVSHELRTPLNAVLGWTKMLLADTLPAQQRRRALQTIERNARAQAQLIEDLLDISRITSGKLRVKFEPVDLATVIDSALEVVRLSATAKNVRVDAIKAADAVPLMGDPDRLQQIMWNLLYNAVKFTPSGGTVTIRLGRRDAIATVVVEDSGQGIARELLPHIFDRFRQADSGTTRPHGGLGLGLTIVRHLVEVHGGTVAAESAGLGHGARFIVELPMAQAESTLPLPFTSFPPAPPSAENVDPAVTDCGDLYPPSSTSMLAAPSLRGLRALVVDDEADARELLESLLEGAGASVRAVASVSDALAAFHQEPPDVLLSDIGMPVRDGYSLIAEVRRLGAEQGGKIPAIALTAYARDEDRDKAVAAGFTLHMCKPIEATRLLSMLSSLCRTTSAPTDRGVPR